MAAANAPHAASGERRRIVCDTDEGETPLSLVGGKAGNLLTLTRAGLPVPPWLCVTTLVHDELLTPLRAELDALIGAIEFSSRAAVREASAQVGERIRSVGLPKDDAKALFDGFDRLFPEGSFVAVRSSAVGEDSAKDSFAGQLDTFLFVTRDTLLARVVDCFASAYSERVLLYRHLRGHALSDVRAAVVVQLMVDSDVAGILFTANPTTRELSEAVVAAGIGLGEGVVSGIVESDTYFVELATGALRQQKVATKLSQVSFDRERGVGTLVTDVPLERRSRPALSGAQLKALVALGRTVQEHKGAPQDIEWAIDRKGANFLLQTRPITTLGSDRESVFDNANIVESYPGLSSPLTFSFARAAYRVAFRQFCLAFGVPEGLVEGADSVFANLLALIDGRIYYNILNWYRFLLLVPGFEWSHEAWEKALGLEHHYTRTVARTLGEKLAILPIVSRVARHIIGEFFRLDRNVQRYLDTLVEVQREFSAKDLDALGAHDLLEFLEGLSRRLLAPYAISIVNDSFAQQLHELVGKLITRYELGDAAALRNSLLAGETGMESVEPVRSMLALAEYIRAHAALRALVEGESAPSAIWEAMHERAEFSEFRAMLREHLGRYGDRTLHELKLETPLAEENPAFVVTMLRNYLRGGQPIDVLEGREQAIRDAAEAKVDDGLRGHPLRRWLFRWALRRLRLGVKHRENLRLARSRAFGMVKRIHRAMGRKLVAAGHLDDGAEIFWLTEEEVFGVVRGHSATRELRGLIAQRKREYEAFRQTRPAPRITTRGIVYGNPFDAPVGADIERGDVLRGIGCSPGKVTAPAKVIIDPSGDLTISGEILVAPMTDPGWVFLMVAAGGIISEKGSLLSHTAIIGRELGIPTVVGVPSATSRIVEGQRLELDGAAGTVRVLDETS